MDSLVSHDFLSIEFVQKEFFEEVTFFHQFKKHIAITANAVTILHNVLTVFRRVLEFFQLFVSVLFDHECIIPHSGIKASLHHKIC